MSASHQYLYKQFHYWLTPCRRYKLPCTLYDHISAQCRTTSRHDCFQSIRREKVLSRLESYASEHICYKWSPNFWSRRHELQRSSYLLKSRPDPPCSAENPKSSNSSYKLVTSCDTCRQNQISLSPIRRVYLSSLIASTLYPLLLDIGNYSLFFSVFTINTEGIEGRVFRHGDSHENPSVKHQKSIRIVHAIFRFLNFHIKERGSGTS